MKMRSLLRKKLKKKVVSFRTDPITADVTDYGDKKKSLKSELEMRFITGKNVMTYYKTHKPLYKLLFYFPGFEI